jgi:hypothetical protein
MSLYDAVPQKLKTLPQWVCWKYVTRDGRLTKVPFNARTGQFASASDPSTWATFSEAVAAADILGNNNYEGIGFELSGSICGMDFDGCIDKKGVVDPYILAILEVLGNPYTETSPSGKGLHALVECDSLPAGGRKMSQSHDGIEIYHGKEGGRYLTITGAHVLGEGVPKIADISLAYLLIILNKDKKFKAMWLGDVSAFKGDESNADFALMLYLAQVTQNDAVKMERYFSASGLAKREKWDRKDYRERTIKAAIESNRSGKIVPPVDLDFKTAAVPYPGREYVIAPAEGQPDGWFPLGDISLIGGSSGTGKTTIIFDMLHRQKQGFSVFEHKTFSRLFHVLAYDRGKHAFERTMYRLGMLESDIPHTALPLASGTKAVQNIIDEIEKMNPIPAVIFLEGLDMLLDDSNKKSIVSKFMRELQTVAEHFHIALLGSVGAPKTKRGEGYAAMRDKLAGSEAWGRNCETVAILEFSEDGDGTTPDRIFSVLPRNAAAERFEMEFQHGKLVCKPPSPEAETGPGLTYSDKVQVAINFLRKSLQGAAKTKEWLMTTAKETEGIKPEALFKAAKVLGVTIDGIYSAGSPVWSLPMLRAGENNGENAPEEEKLTDISHITVDK